METTLPVSLDADELVALAKLDVSANKLDSALLKIKQAFSLLGDEVSPEAYSLGASIYAQLQLFDKAKQLYQTLFSHADGSLHDTFKYGMAHFESGDPEQALNIWEKLLQEYPTHPPSLYYASIAHLERDDRESAQRNLDVLIKSAPTDNLYFERGKELINRMSKRQAPNAGREMAYDSEI